MDEFNRMAWERDKIATAMTSPYRNSYYPPRWSLGAILGGLLMVSLGGFLIWGTFSDLAEHFNPAQPVPVQEESPPDVTGQIRNLERMIAEAKQLNAEINAVHDSIKQTLAAKTR